MEINVYLWPRNNVRWLWRVRKRRQDLYLWRLPQPQQHISDGRRYDISDIVTLVTPDICVAGLLAAGLLGLLALLAFAPRSSSSSGGYGWVSLRNTVTECDALYIWICVTLCKCISIRMCVYLILISYGSQRNSQDYDYYSEGDDFGRRRSGPELVDGEYGKFWQGRMLLSRRLSIAENMFKWFRVSPNLSAKYIICTCSWHCTMKFLEQWLEMIIGCQSWLKIMAQFSRQLMGKYSCLDSKLLCMVMICEEWNFFYMGQNDFGFQCQHKRFCCEQGWGLPSA